MIRTAHIHLNALVAARWHARRAVAAEQNIIDPTNVGRLRIREVMPTGVRPGETIRVEVAEARPDADGMGITVTYRPVGR